MSNSELTKLVKKLCNLHHKHSARENKFTIVSSFITSFLDKHTKWEHTIGFSPIIFTAIERSLLKFFHARCKYLNTIKNVYTTSTNDTTNVFKQKQKKKSFSLLRLKQKANQHQIDVFSDRILIIKTTAQLRTEIVKFEWNIPILAHMQQTFSSKHPHSSLCAIKSNFN